MKFSIVLGTRPEILKLISVISEITRRGLELEIIHTGQHYDHNMSEVFFKDMDLPQPDHFLDVTGNSQSEQVGLAAIEIEKVLLKNESDFVLVVGDTNAGAAAALAASKLCLPIVHYEAGCRSYDMTMPEEVNRKIIDSVASYCFAPTQHCFSVLEREGKGAISYFVGDTLNEIADYTNLNDLIDENHEKANLITGNKKFILATIHRGDNTDNKDRLSKILSALSNLKTPVFMPIHPRTKKMITEHKIEGLARNINFLDPLKYSLFISLLKKCEMVITDSGGVQQESAIFNRKCLTLRNNTEWIETVYEGYNSLIDVDDNNFAANLLNQSNTSLPSSLKSPFIKGAAKKSLDILQNDFKSMNHEINKADFIKHGFEFYFKD